MIQEDYVPFEQAKALKELGFHELVYTESHSYFEGICRHHKPKDFNGEEYSGLNTQWYSRPTLSLVQKWLRGEKKLHIYMTPTTEEALSNKASGYGFDIYVEENGGLISDYESYKTYEEALYAGINKCIELLNKK